jgi:hypothetical protein
MATEYKTADTKSELFADSQRAKQLRKKAEAFVSQSELAEAIGWATLDPKRHAAALAKPTTLLQRAGLSLPDGLAFDLFEHSPRYLPFPDWTPFVLELTACRTYWVLECEDSPPAVGKLRKCEWKERELCLGFRVYPRPWPRGPFTL